MLNLATCQTDDLIQWSQKIFFTSRDSLSSFEEAATHIVECIYNEIMYTEDQPLFTLARIFRTSHYDELLPGIQDLVNPTDEQWLSLFGTVGVERDWNSRTASKNHQAIPIGAVSQAPMLRAAFGQLRLGGFHSDEGGVVTLGDSTMVRYFHVPEALGSPHVPGQAEFVEPYHIESVLGLGSLLASQATSLLIAFTNVAVSEEEAAKFASISPFLMTLLAKFDQPDCLWAT